METSLVMRAPADSRQTKVMEARKRMQKLKMKKARKLLAQNRDSAPQVSIPVIPKERCVVYAKYLVMQPDHYLESKPSEHKRN
jgi:hypothetical protein